MGLAGLRDRPQSASPCTTSSSSAGSRCAPAGSGSPGATSAGSSPAHPGTARVARRAAQGGADRIAVGGRPPANHVATMERYVSRCCATAWTRLRRLRNSVITTSNGGYALGRRPGPGGRRAVRRTGGRGARPDRPPRPAATDRRRASGRPPAAGRRAAGLGRIGPVDATGPGCAARCWTRPGTRSPRPGAGGAGAGRPGGGDRSGSRAGLVHHDDGASRARRPGRRRCRRTTGAGASWPTGSAWSRPRRPARSSWICSGRRRRARRWTARWRRCWPLASSAGSRRTRWLCGRRPLSWPYKFCRTRRTDLPGAYDNAATTSARRSATTTATTTPTPRSTTCPSPSRPTARSRGGSASARSARRPRT